MAKIAIVGESTSVAGFRPLGFAVFAVQRAQDARELWGQLMGGEYGVVFVTEQVYAAVEDLVAESVESAVPAVSIIPGVGSAGGIGGEKIRRAIERALGTSTLIREEED